VDAVTDRVCNIAAPKTGLEAKFSLRLTAAMALAGHDTGRLDEYSAATAADPALVALRDRVVVDLQPHFGSTRAQMDVRMVDQTTVSATHDSGVPAPDVAAQGRRIEAKFLSIATPVLANAEALRDAVDGMDDLKSVTALAPLWATPASARAA
jgi:2-methylcitrate dehydratase PrpD